MSRAAFALLVASLALASPLASGASSCRATSAVSATTEAATKIVLRGRQGGGGPWKRYLWLELVRSQLTSFSVCAVWNRTSSPPPTCRAARGDRLPEGAIMRLEQRLPRSPGWRTVGTSTEAALGAVLSNDVSRNRLGTVTYRVTLRNASGRILGTSNTFKVFWHR
jgi:hypothetical protein